MKRFVHYILVPRLRQDVISSYHHLSVPSSCRPCLETLVHSRLHVVFLRSGAALTLVPTMEGNRAASSAENEKHKTHWSDDETRALLKVWEDHLSDLRKTKRNLKVYVAIAECLRAQGVEKSVKEIKSKMENLGNRYR